MSAFAFRSSVPIPTKYKIRALLRSEQDHRASPRIKSRTALPLSFLSKLPLLGSGVRFQSSELPFVYDFRGPILWIAVVALLLTAGPSWLVSEKSTCSVTNRHFKKKGIEYGRTRSILTREGSLLHP